MYSRWIRWKLLRKIFVGISEANRSLGRPVHSWERQCDIFLAGKNRFRFGFIMITERKFRHLLCTFKPTFQFKSQYLCLCSTSQTVTTTLCLLQQTPVCTHIMFSTHWTMTTAGCSVLRYDLLLVQRRTNYFNFTRFVRNEVVCFSLYANFLNFRILLRSFTRNLVLQWESPRILLGIIYFVEYMKIKRAG